MYFTQTTTRYVRHSEVSPERRKKDRTGVQSDVVNVSSSYLERQVFYCSTVTSKETPRSRN